MAAHVLDNQPPPAELSRAFNYRSWGVVDVMQLPAGLLKRMNTALTAHRAFTGYKEAGAQNMSVEWSRKNPDDWEIVSAYLAERKGVK